MTADGKEENAADYAKKGCFRASAGVILLAGSSSSVLPSRSTKFCVSLSSSSDS